MAIHLLSPIILLLKKNRNPSFSFTAPDSLSLSHTHTEANDGERGGFIQRPVQKWKPNQTKSMKHGAAKSYGTPHPNHQSSYCKKNMPHSQTGPLSPIRCRSQAAPAGLGLRVDGGGRHEPVHRVKPPPWRGRKVERILVFSAKRGGRKDVERSWFKTT